MIKKLICLIFCLFWLGGVFPDSGFSQNVVTDCYGTLEAWKADKSLRNYMATHKCYCPSPNSRPVCTPISSPSSGLSPSQQMQLQMFQGIMAPLFGALGQMIYDSMMPKPDTSYQQRQQEEALRKQQEEAKKKAYEAWQRHMKEAEEQARKEEEARRSAGQDILSQVRIGSGPFGSYTIIGPRVSERETLSRIDWDSPRSQLSSETKSQELAKEQLLRTAYFSKMAETSLQSGDLEAARFYAGLAFEGDAGSPRRISYNPPKELLDAMDSKKATELNNKLTKMAKFYKLAMPNFETLQTIYTELEDIKAKKEESKKKIEELEKQIKELKAKKQASETDNLLAQALDLKQKAEQEYQDVLKNEEKLLKEKQEIENKLNELKGQLLVEEKR